MRAVRSFRPKSKNRQPAEWSNVHRRPVFFQPLLPFSIGGHELIDLVPEGLRVVELVEMAKFVDDEIIQKRFGQINQAEIKA